MPSLSTLSSEEKIIEFLLSDSMASRKSSEQITHATMLDTNPKKYNGKLMLFTIWINPVRKLVSNKDYDAVIDTDFQKPVGILIQRYFRKLHGNVGILI